MTAKPFYRRWWRVHFSLRALLLVVLALGCGLGWLASEIRRAKRQQAAAARIRSQGGHASYAYQINSQGEFHITMQSPLSRLFRGLAGDDFLRHVRRVSLHAPIASNAGLEALSDLPQVRDVRLNSRHVSDGQLRHLKRLRQLEHLDLWCRRVTDQGLQHLSGLTNLAELNIYSTQVTDAGLVHLHGLSNLRVLKVRGTRVSAEGAARLQRVLPDCEILGVEQ